MRDGRYGISMHYQYRILLGYSIATKPPFPDPARMTAEEWNRFVDGLDVRRCLSSERSFGRQESTWETSAT
jgi:hypothetical protein